MSPADAPADTAGSTLVPRRAPTVPAPRSDGDTTATEVCPGCGAVLLAVPGPAAAHPGASPSCGRLFEVTLRGFREEAPADLRTAALLQLATDAYAAQHLQLEQPVPAVVAAARLCLWVARRWDPLRAPEITDRLADAVPRSLTPPARWTTTIADVAADLDVVDLPSLVRSWADAVWADWAPAHGELGAAADGALGSAT